MSDRGPGFFNAGTGKITPEYSHALHTHGLRAFVGEDASSQPGTLQEAMLHETAVAWLRHRMKATSVKEPWLETRQQFAARLRGATQWVNANYNVDALSRQLPTRVSQLIESKRDRLGV